MHTMGGSWLDLSKGRRSQIEEVLAGLWQSSLDTKKNKECIKLKHIKYMKIDEYIMLKKTSSVMIGSCKRQEFVTRKIHQRKKTELGFLYFKVTK